MQELAQLTVLDLKPEFDKETFEKLVESLVLKHESILQCETVRKRKDRTLYPVDIRLQLMREESPSIFVAIVMDISQSKKDKEKLMVYADRLEKSNVELENFAAIASHDPQEPLRKITTFGDRLIDKAINLDEQSQNYIERMQKSAYRMKNFIDDLLCFSKVSTEKIPFQKVNLEYTAKTVCEEISHRIQSTEGVVNIKNLPAIEGRKTQLHQLFSNLIINAIKYKREDIAPVVNIFGVKKDNGFGEITINDNGIGFDQKHAEKVFQPLQRLHGRSQYEGSGSGLSICRKIIHGHNGTIAAKNVPGKGSTILITLPEKQPSLDPVK